MRTPEYIAADVMHPIFSRTISLEKSKEKGKK
jgi:hypothetical protein